MATTMKAEKRAVLGTRASRQFRKLKKVPAIIYGHGVTPVAVALDGRELEKAIHHGDRLLELDLGDQKENVLVKEVQYDTYQQDIIHVDFARVNLDERVTVTVPILLRGTPAGAADGGVIMPNIATVEIECLVTAIPDDVRASVTDMKLGDTLHMKDLPLPEGAKLISKGELIVASCTKIAEEVVAAPAEGEVVAAAATEGAAPEVIGEKERLEKLAADAAGGAKKEKKE